MEKILSICIPTYNRALYLKKCINSIVTQLDESLSNKVELIVLDNNSTDNTENIVFNFIEQGFNVNYIKNEINIGADGNITKAFDVANGKYVLVMGDDDYWVDDQLKKLIKLVNNTEAGIIYLKPFSFSSDTEIYKSNNQSNKYYVFNNGNDFLQKINIMITFISSNVINKQLVTNKKGFVLNKFIGTELNYLNYMYTAALNSKYNIITYDVFIASKADNGSGYNLFEVFGKNLNLVMNYFKTEGLENRVIKRVNYVLTTDFFPSFLLKMHQEKWTFDDNKDEILFFLQNYRKKDYLCKLFLLDIYLNGLNISFFNIIMKKIIRHTNDFLAKLFVLFGFIKGNIYMKFNN